MVPDVVVSSMGRIMKKLLLASCLVLVGVVFETPWLHFRPPPVDFCGSRLAIGAAPECARAPASARYARPSVTNATLAASRLLHRRSPTAPCSKGLAAASRLIELGSGICEVRYAELMP